MVFVRIQLSHHGRRLRNSFIYLQVHWVPLHVSFISWGLNQVRWQNFSVVLIYFVQLLIVPDQTSECLCIIRNRLIWTISTVITIPWSVFGCLRHKTLLSLKLRLCGQSIRYNRFNILWIAQASWGVLLLKQLLSIWFWFANVFSLILLFLTP